MSQVVHHTYYLLGRPSRWAPEINHRLLRIVHKSNRRPIHENSCESSLAFSYVVLAIDVQHLMLFRVQCGGYDFWYRGFKGGFFLQ